MLIQVTAWAGSLPLISKELLILIRLGTLEVRHKAELNSGSADSVKARAV